MNSNIEQIIQRRFGILRPVALFFTVMGVTGSSIAVPNSALCVNGQCQPMISATKYFNREAFKITDGKTQAIVVPSIGRIMSYGKFGGKNLLWNSPTSAGINWGWINYGGDKNWLAPQSYWSIWHSTGGWPPDSDFDGKPHIGEVLSGGKLRMTSPLSPSTGIRFIRTIYFDANGDLVIEQVAKKEKGPRVKAAIWNITQIVPGDAVFVPLNPNSPYKNNYHRLSTGKVSQKIETINPKLLRVKMVADGGGWKIGADSPVSSIASVKDGVAFVQKTAKPAGEYPDGAVGGSGFPVELYVNGDKKVFYCELELLGPLRDFVAGSKSTHTLRWSLHDLPSKDVNSKAVTEAVQGLLMEK